MVKHSTHSKKMMKKKEKRRKTKNRRIVVKIDKISANKFTYILHEKYHRSFDARWHWKYKYEISKFPPLIDFIELKSACCFFYSFVQIYPSSRGAMPELYVPYGLFSFLLTKDIHLRCAISASRASTRNFCKHFNCSALLFLFFLLSFLLCSASFRPSLSFRMSNFYDFYLDLFF